MAKVKIQGHASGTGVLTVTAPNTSTDRTITLPDSTGTILDENSSLPAANITGTLPAISGANLTNLPSDIEVSDTAPGSPTQGDLWFNSSGSTVSSIPTKNIAVYNNAAWKRLNNVSMTATGGTITTSGGYTIHTFTSSGTFTPDMAGTVDYLVVAAGGGGGIGGTGEPAGGGGAGAFLTATDFAVAATGLTVTIGAGGATGGDRFTNGSVGGDSVFSSITAAGGGGGISGGGAAAPSGTINGGSGGGGNGYATLTGGTGTTGGNDGGDGVNSPGSGHYGGGGGGGAGAVGADGSVHSGGVGGVGLANSYSGSSVYYAGGGGGGSWVSGGNSAGGNGGGGAGGENNGTQTGVAGTANTGGGGGGGVDSSAGGAGGSGIVIIRYPT